MDLYCAVRRLQADVREKKMDRRFPSIAGSYSRRFNFIRLGKLPPQDHSVAVNNTRANYDQ